MPPREAKARVTRKAAGRYDTPAALGALVVDLALDSLLERAERAPRPAEALLSLRVLDPTCGVGNLLVVAARRIASHLARARAGADPSDADLAEALRDVVSRCVYGVERDTQVADRARDALEALAGCPLPREHVHTDDAISLACDRRWNHLFPLALADGGFDAVIGNPPFLNAIEHDVATVDRGKLRALHPEIGATADASFYFLAIADALRRPGGSVAMVLPRSLLSAPSARRLRTRLAPFVSALYAPETQRLFEGARVLVCVVALGDRERCAVSRDDDPATAQWRESAIEDDGWWRAVVATSDAPRSHSTAPRVGERFEVSASMTTSEAYAIVDHVVDAESGTGPELLTTGLIDRGASLWGERVCRYLGRKLSHPRLRVDEALPASVMRRVERAKRPKIIVGGLGRVVECFLDERGRSLGTVATWTITHPTDDVGALRRLVDLLHSPATDEHLRNELGATALGSGSITVTRRFLDDLALPDDG